MKRKTFDALSRYIGVADLKKWKTVGKRIDKHADGGKQCAAWLKPLETIEFCELDAAPTAKLAVRKEAVHTGRALLEEEGYSFSGTHKAHMEA